MAHYNIIDFKACMKHAYYGASDPEAMHCIKTDRRFPHWQVGASGIITRYARSVLEAGDSFRNLLVCHDMGKEFRLGIYPEYKGQKSKKDENKSPIEIEQLTLLEAWAKRFFTAIGATQLGVNGVEADDVIAWCAQQIEKAGGTAAIRTVDFDLAQLVSDQIAVITPNYTFFGAEGRFQTDGKNELDGFLYRHASFCKSIMGDSSDNYGGVKGMGKVAMLNLQRDFGDDGLDELIQIVDSGNTDSLNSAIEESGSKELKKLLSQFSEWKLGWRLAQLRPELCWKPRKQKLIKPVIHKRIANGEQLHKLLAEVDCLDLWDDKDDFSAIVPNPFLVDASNWGEYREGILAEIALGDRMAFDWESTDKDPIAAFRRASTRGNNFVDTLSQELTGASFQFGRHLENVIYIPVDHRDSMNLNKEVVLEILEHARKSGVRRVAHNAFFEGVVAHSTFGIWLQDIEDTRIMQRFFNENAEAGLKFMSLEYLGYKQATYEETLAKGSIRPEGAKNMAELTAEETVGYGADDSLVTGHLSDLMELMLILDGQWLFYKEWAIKPTEVLQRSYVDGVKMNWALQKRLHQRDLKTIEEGMLELHKILRENVNGNLTAGAKSLIEAERDYIYKSALKKLDNKDLAQEKFAEWKKVIEASCQYTPYREELVMPAFAFTEKQISAAAVKVGLPALEKLNYKAWDDYLAKVGAVGFRNDWKFTPDQQELIDTVTEAMKRGVLNISSLKKKVEEPEEGATITPEEWQRRLDAAEAYKEYTAEVVQRLAGVEARVVSFGDPLNVGSPQQMQRLLYCKIGVPVRLRGKISKGRLSIGVREAGPSTDEKAIEWALANDIPEDDWRRDALAVLYKVKSATTRCSLYHDKYPLWLHRDGKVHYYITDYGTDTGRPTGSSMNVLQVSKRKEKVMRSNFIPPSPDYVCVAIDFNGQEIRLMANLANDPVMMSVYDPADEKDLHSMTAAGIMKLPYDEYISIKADKEHKLNKIAAAMRNKAKTVNFGMAYGSGAGTLSRNLVAPREEAQDLLDATMALYSRIRVWQDESGKFMEKNGFTLTAYGNKRHANSDIFHKDEGKVARQKRQGANFEIQGTAADMLRIALTKVASTGMMDRLRMSFFAPIYDEVVSWVHKDDVLQYCQEMGAILESTTPPGHKVRQVPEYSIGADWGSVEELGRDISPENVAKFVAEALENAKSIWDVDMLEPFDPILKHVNVEVDEDEEVELEVMPFD